MGAMTIVQRVGLAMALAVLALTAPFSSPARARVAVARRCPVHPPDDGDPCTRETQTCSWGCSAEGSTIVGCSCVRSDDDDALHWRCVQGDTCPE
jgi:hypothetical protein